MSLAHAILSTLIDRPSSGYDLAKDFDRRVSHFWHASHQQIYLELGRMERDGWVKTKLIEQEDRPNRKLYSITAQGKKALSQWVAQPSDVVKIREDLLVKLRAGSLVDRQILVDELKRHRQAHADNLAFYDSIHSQNAVDPKSMSLSQTLDHLVLRCGTLYEQAYLTWCDEALELLGDDAER